MIGKTIENYGIYDSYMAIFFTDGTHEILRARSGCDGDASIEEYGSNREGLDDHTAMRLGFLTDEQYKARRAKKEQEYEARKHQREHEEYTRLKAKYEGKS
jgi:hypothetical protein